MPINASRAECGPESPALSRQEASQHKELHQTLLQNQRFACHCVARRPRLIFLRVALRLTFVRARSQRRAAAPRATWAASGTAGVRREAGLGRRRDAWPLLRPSRTLKRRQPAARPRILHTRRHDQAERARCRVMVRAACEGRLWPQQIDQTDLKACRRRAVVARAETAAEEPSAVASQRLPGPPSGSPCPF